MVIRHLRAWWAVAAVGSAREVARTIEEYYRYHVIKFLAEEGLFDFLQEPRTYGQILARFGFVDSDYTREIFDLLASERRNVLLENGGAYHANPGQPPPTLEELFAQTEEHYHKFSPLAADLTKSIPSRLRHEPVEFTGSFEEEGRELLTTFDKWLGNKIYTVSRDVAFALLKRSDYDRLYGKKLLDIGCGSGREPAELWLRLGGNVHIMAIDPVPSLLERAIRNLEALLDEIDPHHPPLEDGNRPVFREASVTQLPFDDESFDAAFHSHILHWTYDPRRAIAEIVRVLKPGGLVFGVQTCKPYTSHYSNAVIRSNENCYGFFWKEEFLRWYAEHGVEVETATPGGAFRGRKPG